LPCGAPVGKYSVWSTEGLPSIFGPGSRQASGRALAACGSAWGWACDQCVSRLVGLWVGGGGVGVVACLFFQCVMAWRSLPHVRGSQYWSFRSPWCFTSAKHVSSISQVPDSQSSHCVCVPVAILDPPVSVFKWEKHSL
jgi:hypothetical protein